MFHYKPSILRDPYFWNHHEPPIYRSDFGKGSLWLKSPSLESWNSWQFRIPQKSRPKGKTNRSPLGGTIYFQVRAELLVSGRLWKLDSLSKLRFRPYPQHIGSLEFWTQKAYYEFFALRVSEYIYIYIETFQTTVEPRPPSDQLSIERHGAGTNNHESYSCWRSTRPKIALFFEQ